MAWKQVVKDYLTFSKKDRIGALLFMALLAAIYLLPILFARKVTSVAIQSDSVLHRALNTRQSKTDSTTTEDSAPAYYQYEPSITQNKGFKEGLLFPFDPNTLSLDGWQKLGLNQRTIRILNNYRAKGGRFYKPEDLKKIWSMPEGFYDRVKNYINIPSSEKQYSQTNNTKQRPENKIAVLNINEADTAAFIALPGIGSKLANRIVNFRERLGGFHSVDQIGDTYGLPDSTFQKLKQYFVAEKTAVKQFNINTSSKDDLKSHPYIRWNLANAIVEYRNQHGSYTSLEDLYNIALINDSIFKKIAPYITIQ